MKKILLVMADDLNCKIMQSILGSLGYTAVTARNGDEVDDLISDGTASTCTIACVDLYLDRPNAGAHVLQLLKESGLSMGLVLMYGNRPSKEVETLLHELQIHTARLKRPAIRPDVERALESCMQYDRELVLV